MIEVKITYEVFSKDGFSICSCAVLSGAEEIPDFVGNKNSIKTVSYTHLRAHET